MLFQERIPNKEVREIYVLQIQEWFKKNILKKNQAVPEFCRVLEHGNAEIVEKQLTRILGKMISIMDTKARDDQKENFYHGILLGILSYKNDWRVSSNRESGEGFSDIVIETGDAETGIVIEVKYTDEKKDLERDCRKALKQIRDKDYTQTLWQEGYEKVVQYGIAFHLKQSCVMEEVECG